MQTKRDLTVDILKGIGIVSVVIGHAGGLHPILPNLPFGRFVYLYHLMIFFFAAGMVYHPQKYKSPYAYIGRQLETSLPLYVKYVLVALLLHNTFARTNILDISLLNHSEIFIAAVSTSIMLHSETITGALWFVPMFVVSKAIFAVGFQTAEKFSSFKFFAHLSVIALAGFIGLFANYRGMFFSYHIQTAYLGVPVIYLGYWYNRCKKNFNLGISSTVCILSAVILFLLLMKTPIYIDLSENMIISPLAFYPITVLGIIFCLSAAELIKRLRLLGRLFSYFGNISFHIMALHFLVFKLFDRIIGHCIMGVDLATTMNFPVAFHNMGLLYTVLGLGVPAIAVYLYRHIATTIKAKISTIGQLSM